MMLSLGSTLGLVLESGIQHLEDAGAPLPALMTDRRDMYSSSGLSPPNLLPYAGMSASLEQLLLLHGQRSGLKCKREGLIRTLLLKVLYGSWPGLRAGSERVQMGDDGVRARSMDVGGAEETRVW